MSESDDLGIEPMEFSKVRKAVIWNASFYTAGASLSSAGFLVYFGKEMGAQGIAIAWLLAIPETLGILGHFSRSATRLLGDRKVVWITFSLIARLAAILIPLLAFAPFRNLFDSPIIVLIVALMISSASQAIAYSALLSWFSDLVPRKRLGELFSRREVTRVSLLIFIPVAAGYFRDWSKNEWSSDGAFFAFGIVFLIGLILQLIAIIPLLKLPKVAIKEEKNRANDFRVIWSAFQNSSLRLLIFGHWWLAAFQGLTQAIFIFYLYGQIKIGLAGYYVLMGVMFFLQIPLSLLAGWLSDHRGEKWPLIISLFVTSCAMPFWFIAGEENWYWIFGAYIFWGAFAVTNITGRNLLLKLSPESDNQLHLWLFRQSSGFLAGLMGILGVYLLNEFQSQELTWSLFGQNFGPFQTLFAISFFGRITTPLWFLRIREPNQDETDDI